jgi:hypothetical protein
MVLCALIVAGFVCVLPAVASAQAFGVRAGASSDPDQLYLGAHILSGPIAGRVHFRPNVELGLGDDLTLVALNMEFVYQYPFRRSQWSLIAGGGPAANVFVWDNGSGRGHDSDVRAGINALLGVSHRDGFFVEVKLGFIDSPAVKLGIGVTF